MKISSRATFSLLCLAVALQCLVSAVAAASELKEMKAYCINLPSEEDRRSHMEGEFQAADITDITWVGVDGNTIDLSQYTFLHDDVKSTLLRSEIGALLSHVSVWREIAKSDAPVSLVFEDDVVLPSTFSSQLEAAVSELPEDWHIMYLSYLKAWEFKKPATFSAHLVTPSWPLGFYAYALSPAGAKALLELVDAGLSVPTDCVDCGIDSMVASWIYNQKITALAANPEICYNSFAFTSTIGLRDARVPRDLLEALQSATPTPTPPSPSPITITIPTQAPSLTFSPRTFISAAPATANVWSLFFLVLALIASTLLL